MLFQEYINSSEGLIKIMAIFCMINSIMSLTSKLERVHHKTCQAITGAIQGTSCERLNKELGLEFHSNRRWVRKLTFLYKIVKESSPFFKRLERK